MNEKDLLEILNQMSEPDPMENERDGIFTSDDSPSWIAHRRAEEISDASFIPFLADLLDESSHADFRMNIYFILKKIGENTGDERVVAILLEWLEKEKNKYALMYILQGIAEQKIPIDCSGVLKFVQDKRWQVRHAAIECLQVCNNKQIAEETLIGILIDSNDKYDLYYATSILAEVGSKRAIPYLIKIMENSSGDLKCTAINALSDLGDDSLLPLFLEALESRSSFTKYHALLAVINHGDETAIVPILERAKVILKRKRIVESGELQSALEFLVRFKDERQEIQDLFNWIVQKKWDLLFEEEKKWLTEASLT